MCKTGPNRLRAFGVTLGRTLAFTANHAAA